MNKNDLSHEHIKQLLNHSVTQLERPTLTRLHHAREQAMAHHAAKHCGEPVFTRAGLAIWHAVCAQHRSRWWITTLLVATILLSTTAYWNNNVKSDTTDIDIAILTGDLPIRFYVD